MLYGTVFFIIFLALSSELLKKKSEKRVLFSFAIFFLVLVNGLRDPFLYPDNINYYYYFSGYFSEAADGTLGWGYITLTKIIRFFTASYPVYFFIIAYIIVSSYAKVIKEYSPYKWIALIIFLLVNYFPSFFLLRQYLVMPFFFLCVKFTILRKPMPFFICLVLAIAMHTTAIIITPLYFLYGLPNTKSSMWLIAVGSVLAMLAFVAIGPLLSIVGSYYLQYFNMVQEEPAWQRAVMKIAIMAVYLFALRQSFYDVGINRILFYSFLFNVIICVGAINLFGVFRLREYFSIADFIGIPVILKSIRGAKKHRRIIVYFAVAIYVALLALSFVSFVEGANMFNNYQFFWEGRPVERQFL